LPLADVNKFVPSLDKLGKGDLAGAAAGLFSDSQDNALGATNPFIKMAVEKATNTNTYTGQQYTDTEAGPLYRLLSLLPFVPDAHRDPKTGKLVASGYSQNVIRNLLPPLAAAERLSPVAQTESGGARLPMNWWNATVGGVLPVTPQAAVNDTMINAAQRSQLKTLADAANRAAGDAGVDPDWIALMQKEGYTLQRIQEMIAAGQGRFGSYEQIMNQRWLSRASQGGFTAREQADFTKRFPGP